MHMLNNLLTNEINQFNNDVIQLEQQACENIFTALQHLNNLLEDSTKHSLDIETINTWLISMLKGMLNAKTLEEMQAYQTSFMEAIQHVPQTSLNKPVIEACLKNIDILFTVRSTYLNKLSSHASITKNFGWMALGTILIVVGVLVPPVEIIVISLGVIGYVYGAIDFAKEAAEPLSKKGLPKLGQRDISQFNTTVKNLIDPNRKTPGESVSLLQSAKKKIIKTVGLIASGIGLTSGGAALLIALPSIAAIFPPALPFVLAAIGLAAAVVAGSIYICKLYQERQKLKQALNKQVEISNQYKNRLNKNQSTNTELETTALMEKKLLGLKKNQHLNSEQKNLFTENLATLKTSEINLSMESSTLKTLDTTLEKISQNEQQPLMNNGEEEDESGTEGEGGRSNDKNVESFVENNIEAEETKPGMGI